MNRSVSDPDSAPLPAGVRWFALRVLVVTALLAVPILATSYALVSSVSADIGMASMEHSELEALARIVTLVPRIETVHRDVTRRDAAAERRDRAAADAAFAAAQQAYAGADALPATTAALQTANLAWSRSGRGETIDAIDQALFTIQEIGSELDDDLPLENDPSSAVQYLVASTLQNSPRSIVAVRRTADAVTDARGPHLDAPSIERIATSNALGGQPLERLFADISSAVTTEPRLRAQLIPMVERARANARAFNAAVDRVLASVRSDPRTARNVEQLAQRAIDAQMALMQAGRTRADALVADYQPVTTRTEAVVSAARA